MNSGSMKSFGPKKAFAGQQPDKSEARASRKAKSLKAAINMAASQDAMGEADDSESKLGEFAGGAEKAKEKDKEKLMASMKNVALSALRAVIRAATTMGDKDGKSDSLEGAQQATGDSRQRALDGSQPSAVEQNLVFDDDIDDDAPLLKLMEKYGLGTLNKHELKEAVFLFKEGIRKINDAEGFSPSDR
ncbi:MAG: hypothetical protein ACI9BD_000382 [Candidatus Marinamargulisbacteria bacterium]|jgi:hypothetical protein